MTKNSTKILQKIVQTFNKLDAIMSLTVYTISKEDKKMKCEIKNIEVKICSKKMIVVYYEFGDKYDE